MAVEKILITDTLENGFRLKTNNAIDSLVVDDATVTDAGVARLPKFDGSFWDIDLTPVFFTKSEVSALVNPSIRQATEIVTGQVRKATLDELINGSSDFAYISATGLKYALENMSQIVDSNVIADNLFENGLVKISALDNEQIGFSVLDGSLDEIAYLQLKDGSWESSGGFSMKSGDFVSTLLPTTLTADRIATLPDRDIEINKWSDLSGVPTSFTPSEITLSGDVTGTGQNSITTQIANTTVTGKILTGLNVGGGSILSTDSLIVAFGKLQNQLNAVSGAVVFQSTWNASTNSPTIQSGVGIKGQYYIVSTNGTTNIDGISDWKEKDWIIFDGTAWQKIDNTDSVSSVNGFQGAVSLTTDNINEGSSNLYFTNSRFDTRFDTSFANKISTQVTFGSNIIVQGFRSNDNAFFYANIILYGSSIFDKNLSTGTANQVLMPVSGGVAWTTIDWSHINGKPTSFTPSAHFHTIGDIIDLSVSLANKQPLNGDLTAITSLSGTSGILRKNATNTWALDTTNYLSANQNITLSGDVTGTGTTAITTTLSNTGVTAGTYRSVTVDAKGRVTAGSVPNYNAEWDSRWNEKLLDFIEFESDVQVNGGVGLIGNLFLGGNFFDKDSSIGTTNQVLMPVSGGVVWTTLSTAQISDFSTNVLGQLLTGFTVGSNTAITESNSILTAFQNGQGQINAINSTVSNLQSQITTNAGKINGTTNFLSKFDSTSSIALSQIYDDGINIGIGTTSLGSKFHIFTSQVGAGVDGIIVGNNDSSYGITHNSRFYTQSYGNGKARTLFYAASNSTNTTQGQFDVVTENGGGFLISVGSDATGTNTVGLYSLGGTESVRINSNGASYFNGGNVAIGQTTAAYGLDVNGTGRFTGAVQFDAIPSCSVAPTSSNHLTNKAYVDSLSFVKKGDNVKTISLTNITLSGTQTINGVALVVGDLILVAGQTTATENGVYVVDSSIWTRSTTNDSDTEIRGAYHLITAGTYINQRYINTNGSAITVGSTAIAYTLDFGQESDPVWSAFQTANDITVTRIGNWNSAYTWGNHASQGYVKNTGDETIAGIKTFSSELRGVNLRYTGTLKPQGYAPTSSGMVLMSANTTTNYWKSLEISDIATLQTSLDAKATIDANLVAISALNTVGFIRRTGAGTYAIDANTYLNITGGTMTGALNLSNSVRVGGTGTNDDNTYFGKNTLISRSTGTGNSAIGSSTLGSLTTGSNNTSLGRNAGASVTTGAYNLFLGSNVGSGITTGSNNVLIGGQLTGLSATLTNNIIIADGAGNRRINVSSIGNVGIGTTSPIYRVDVSGDINITGTYRINGSFGADHTFLKSNGTTQGWSLITVGEISDISSTYLSISNAISTYLSIDDADTYYTSKTYTDLNYVKRVTDEGERGFFLYADAENTVKEGFLFTNPDTGIIGIHAYRLNGSTIEQYGFQIDKDGLPYWLFTDGSRKRILTENDAVGGGGNTPWTGGVVSNSLDFQFGKAERYLADNGSLVHKQYSGWNGENFFSQETTGNHLISATKGIYLDGGVNDYVYIDNVAFDMSNVAALVGSNARFNITSIGGGKYKATLVAG